jgi:hypothetical protein
MAVPVGALLIGPLIELIGVIPTLGIVVAMGAAAPIVCYLVPVFREIDHEIEITEPAPAADERAFEPVA